MMETDILSHEITALMAQQRAAWRELAKPELTQFDRRELRNRIRQAEVELRDFLKMRTERLRFRPRAVEPPIDSLANIAFRLF
jgi:transposase